MRLCFSLDEARAAHDVRPVAVVMAANDVAALLPPLPGEDFLSVNHPAARHDRLMRRRLLAFLVQLHGFEPQFSRGPSGEVVLACGRAFLSSSSRDGLVAAALGPSPLGVDVEAPLKHYEAPFAMLHEAERAFLQSSGADPALIWAAKEAVWKACRMDLSRDPSTFAALPDAEGFFNCEGVTGQVRFNESLACFIATAIA